MAGCEPLRHPSSRIRRMDRQRGRNRRNMPPRAWRDGFRPALPMPPPAIPSVEQVGKSIIADAPNRMDHREAK